MADGRSSILALAVGGLRIGDSQVAVTDGRGVPRLDAASVGLGALPMDVCRVDAMRPGPDSIPESEAGFDGFTAFARPGNFGTFGKPSRGVLASGPRPLAVAMKAAGLKTLLPPPGGALLAAPMAGFGAKPR